MASDLLTQLLGEFRVKLFENRQMLFGVFYAAYGN
jgi:hypothetical protein